MRKSLTLLIGIIASLIALDVNAQQLPKTGASLTANENTIELTYGNDATIEVKRLRSKSYKKAKFGGIRVNTPEGLESSITSSESNPDLYMVKFSATDGYENGKYTVTIQGEGRNASKVKGTMITVLVNSANLATNP